MRRVFKPDGAFHKLQEGALGRVLGVRPAALKEQHAQIEATMKRLKYKISRYENAVKTGVLSWDDCPEDINIKHS